MSPALLVAAALLGGEPFTRAKPLVGRAVKPPAVRPIAVGARLRVAPLLAEAKQVMRDYAALHPSARAVMDLAPRISLELLQSVSDELFGSLWLGQPGLTPSQREALESIDFIASREPVEAVTVLAHDGEPLAPFTIEAWATWTGEDVELTALLPLVVLALDTDATAALGNLTLDARVGHLFDPGLALALTWGAELSLPTASARSGAAAQRLATGRLVPGVVGFTPYVLGALEAGVLTLQVGLSLPLVAPGGSGAPPDTTVAFGYEAAVILTPDASLSVVLEAVGQVTASGPLALDAHVAALGLEAHFGPVHPSFGLEIPLGSAPLPEVGGSFGALYRRWVDLAVTAGIEARW